MSKRNQLNNYLNFLAVICLLMISNTTFAEDTPAFPGAEGFGRYTIGGRGGAVYHVTSLADDGSQGTFRWAVNKGGKRTIVFDISGTIHLTSALPLRNGFVTIAGQTAPGDGVCIADYPFTINASNVIIRFMRFRLGNKYVAYHEGDGLGGMDQQDIIVDHCSVSWSIDECCSVYGNHNSTVQWCIVSQSLRNAGHEKGPHGYGGNWGGSGASYHHNLLAHHDSRTPRLGPRAGTQTDERMDLRNNVIYNWAGNGCYGGEGMNVNIVDNYYKPGPGTKQRSSLIQYRIAKIGIRTNSYVEKYPAFSPMLHVWGDFYVDGNYMEGHSDVTADNWTKGIYAQISNDASVDYTYTQETKDTMKMDSPLDYIYTTTQTPQVAYERVLDYAGASLSRDWVDTLMVYDTRNGVASHTGSGSGDKDGIIDSQEDNKPANAPSDWNPWPTLKSDPTPLDTDQDGIPDSWENTHNLNPNDASDGNIKTSDGYTNLEVYMNSLVQSIMTSENVGGEPTGYTITSNAGGTSTATLAASTFVGVSGASSPWKFVDGYSVTNENGKGYATGKEDGVKYSSGVQFTIHLPDNVKVTSVKFTGYDNYDGSDAYVSELNGKTFSSTDYIFTKKDANGNYTVCTNTVDLDMPASGSFTFTIGAKQSVLSIELTTTTSTGIETWATNKSDPNELINVYSVDGRVIRSEVKRSEAIRNLKNGVYIVDGKKIGIMR